MFEIIGEPVVGVQRTLCFPPEAVPSEDGFMRHGLWCCLPCGCCLRGPKLVVIDNRGSRLALESHGCAIHRIFGNEPCRPFGLAGYTLALEDSYLVDPASSHMLVSKIKPCMSKYKQLYGETANGSLNQL